MTRIATLALALFLSSCMVYSSKHPRGATHRAACQQAYEQGWCYEDCRKRPDHCCEPRNVRCSGGLCVWTGCDGSLVFGF